MPEKNYYDILKVDPKADIDAIKHAYRNLMRQYHPDKFAADLSRLQKNNDKKSLGALERKMQDAKVQAQKVNEAYAVLTDEDKRKAYDQKLSDERMAIYQAEVRRQRTRHPDVHRRTVKTRRHRPTKKQAAGQGETFPRVLFAAFVLFSIIVFSTLTRMASNSSGSNNTRSANRPTEEGMISIFDMQATQDMVNATRIARTQTADDPTITPLSPEQYERSADRLMERGLTTSAIDAYDRALHHAPDDPGLFFKRGLAYLELFESGDDEASDAALHDFEQALILDTTYAEAYRERGLLFFTLWQDGDEGLAAPARQHLQRYQILVNMSDEAVDEALATLNADEE